MGRDDHSRRLGAPPSDWRTSSDVVSTRGEKATPRSTDRLGGPPPEFGDAKSVGGKRLLTALVVSEDKELAATVVFDLAQLGASVRIALHEDDVESQLSGAQVVFVLVASERDPLARRASSWKGERLVVLLAREARVVDRLRGIADVALPPPWAIDSVVRELGRS